MTTDWTCAAREAIIEDRDFEETGTLRAAQLRVRHVRSVLAGDVAKAILSMLGDVRGSIGGVRGSIGGGFATGGTFGSTCGPGPFRLLDLPGETIVQREQER